MSTTQNTPSGQNDKVEEYDLVILGSGTGGTVAAWTFAGKGQHVAVIERKYVGGSCPNIACLPSKNVIHSAKVASYFRRSEEFGIPKRDFAVGMRAVRERKRKMVSYWNNVYLDNYKKSGAEFILGSGRFVSPKTVETILPDGRTRRLRGKNVIINTALTLRAHPFQVLMRRNHSHTSKRWNWTNYPNTYLSWAAAMSDWSWLRRCVGSEAR